MNRYLIVFGEKHYVTNADNMLEAEEKVFEHFGDVDNNIMCKVSKIESLDCLDKKDETIFF